MAQANRLWVLPASLSKLLRPSLYDPPCHPISLFLTSLLFLDSKYLLSSSPRPRTHSNLPSSQKGTFKSLGTHTFSGYFFSPSDDLSYSLGLRMSSRPRLCGVSGYTVSWTHFPGTGPPHPAVIKAAFPTVWLKWDSQRLLSPSQLCPPSGQFLHSAHWNVKAQMGDTLRMRNPWQLYQRIPTRGNRWAQDRRA